MATSSLPHPPGSRAPASCSPPTPSFLHDGRQPAAPIPKRLSIDPSHHA